MSLLKFCASSNDGRNDVLLVEAIVKVHYECPFYTQRKWPDLFLFVGVCIFKKRCSTNSCLFM